MRNATFDLTPFTLPIMEVGTQQATPRYEATKVGYGLFQLWNQFQAQVKGMADPHLIVAMNAAVAKHQSGQWNEDQYKTAVGSALAQSNARKSQDPGVDRKELIAALRAVKENMKSTGLDPQTKMELMGYAQQLLDGLAQTNAKTVEVGSMTRWLLVGLGFKGEGLF